MKITYIIPTKDEFCIFLLPIIGYDYSNEAKYHHTIGILFICFGIIIDW